MGVRLDANSGHVQGLTLDMAGAEVPTRSPRPEHASASAPGGIVEREQHARHAAHSESKEEAA